MCVRGRDAYTGADLERACLIDHIKLPVKERNQYGLKAKQAACGMCVWALFIQPDMFRDKLFLKMNDHLSRSRTSMSMLTAEILC